MMAACAPSGDFFFALCSYSWLTCLLGRLWERSFASGRVHPSILLVVFWQSLVGLVAILAAYKLMTAVFDRRPLGSVGLAFHPRWGRELGRGLAVGAGMLFLAIVPEWGCGFVRFTFTPHPILRAGSFSFIIFAMAAANEEAIFRGYPFQRLAESITPVGAIGVTSALFGLAHLANPHRTWISTLNTALVGIPFCHCLFTDPLLVDAYWDAFYLEFPPGLFPGVAGQWPYRSVSLFTAPCGVPLGLPAATTARKAACWRREQFWLRPCTCRSQKASIRVRK